MLRRLYEVVRLASVTRLKSPPTTTVVPTTAMARTVPSVTCGVLSTGLADTTPDCAVSARAGSVMPRPVRTVAAATAIRRRRIWTGTSIVTHKAPNKAQKGQRATRPLDVALHRVHHEERRPLQVLPQRRVLVGRQVERVERPAHVPQPGVPLGRADPERRVPHPQSGMAALVGVAA